MQLCKLPCYHIKCLYETSIPIFVLLYKCMFGILKDNLLDFILWEKHLTKYTGPLHILVSIVHVCKHIYGTYIRKKQTNKQKKKKLVKEVEL